MFHKLLFYGAPPATYFSRARSILYPRFRKTVVLEKAETEAKHTHSG